MICKNCGKIFEIHSSRHIYCSDYCRVAAYQKQHSLINNLTCKSCGKTFNGRVDAFYCSARCKQVAYRERKNSENDMQYIFTIGSNGKKDMNLMRFLRKLALKLSLM